MEIDNPNANSAKYVEVLRNKKIKESWIGIVGGRLVACSDKYEDVREGVMGFLLDDDRGLGLEGWVTDRFAKSRNQIFKIE